MSRTVGSSFPRWQIRRADGGDVWGMYSWVDGGDGAEPGWVVVEEGELVADYVAVQVSAIQIRRYPPTGDAAVGHERPLVVDDEWIDDDGDLNRCERIYETGDTILLSWESPEDRRVRVYEKHLTALVVGQKRADGSIIGPPEVAS